MKLNRRLRSVVVASGVLGILGASTIDEFVLAQGEGTPPRAEKSRPKVKEAIGETKTKGFDGVDFSYDAFGAPMGQDPVKISEQVKNKDMAEKSKVLAKQKQLLAERYKLECHTQPSVVMTNGKPQPIGPNTYLKNGLSWDKLSSLDAN